MAVRGHLFPDRALAVPPTPHTLLQHDLGALPVKGGVFFSSPQIWADAMTCFGF